MMDPFDTYIDPGLKFIKKEAIKGMDAVSATMGGCTSVGGSPM